MGDLVAALLIAVPAIGCLVFVLAPLAVILIARRAQTKGGAE